MGCERAGPEPASSPMNPEHPFAGVPVRTDLEPLHARFPRLGAMVEAHWQGRVVGADSWVPGPSDTLIQAVVVLKPGDLTAATTGYTWQPAESGWDRRMTAQLRPFAPASGDWRYSEQFELDVRTQSFHGSVYLDFPSGTVYLNVYTS